MNLANLLKEHIVKSDYRVDISTLVAIIVSPYAKLHELAMKAFSVLSDTNYTDHVLFEN